MQNGEAVKASTSTSLPLVIGVSILDITMAMAENMPTAMDGAMYHGKSAQSAGGVGRNLAESIYKLYGDVNFISLIGEDIIGEILLKLIPEKIAVNIAKEAAYRTSSCTVIIDKRGDCRLILGDMEIHEKFHRLYIEKRKSLFSSAPLIIIDGNLPVETISYILKESQNLMIPVFYEPTDLRISGKPFGYIPKHLTQQIRLLTPNYYELENIVRVVHKDFQVPTLKTTPNGNGTNILDSVRLMLNSIGDLFDCVIVTLGQCGVVLGLNSSIDPYQESLFRNHKYILDTTKPIEASKRIIFFPTPNVVKDVVNVSGAGDSFAGGFISGLLKEWTVVQSISMGFRAARKALQTTAAVPDEYYPVGMEKSSLWQMEMNALKIPGNANEQVLN